MIYQPGTRSETLDIYTIVGDEMRSLLAVYVGTENGADLIWKRISSCYGTGVWLPNKPWLDDDKWKNNR